MTWPVIREVKVSGRRRWMVDGRPYFGREFFPSEPQARDRQWTMRLDRGSEAAVRLSTSQKVDAVRALEVLREVPGGSLVDAARLWVERNGTGRGKVGDALAEWLLHRDGEKKAGRIRNGQHKNGRWAVGVALPAWGEVRVSEVGAVGAQAWLDGLRHGPWARANLRTALRSAWGWMVRTGKARENPWAEVRADVPETAVTILSLPDVETLLDHARGHPAALRYCLLGLGAGLRPVEAERARAEALVPPASFHVRAAKTRERYVTLEPWLWTALAAEGAWPGDLAGQTWRKLWMRVRVEAGWGGVQPGHDGEARKTWPADVLRHSFASYWLAVHQDRARLAEVMGNSVEVIARHYRRPVPREVGEAFFTKLACFTVR